MSLLNYHYHCIRTTQYWTDSQLLSEQIIAMVGLWGVIQVCSTPLCSVQCIHLITKGGTSHLYNRGSSKQFNSAFWSRWYVNSPIVYRLPWFKHWNWLLFHEQFVGVNGKMFWWLIKNFLFTASWLRVGSYLQRPLSAQVNWGGGVADANTDRGNSQFLRSRSQASLVMWWGLSHKSNVST